MGSDKGLWHFETFFRSKFLWTRLTSFLTVLNSMIRRRFYEVTDCISTYVIRPFEFNLHLLILIAWILCSDFLLSLIEVWWVMLLKYLKSCDIIRILCCGFLWSSLELTQELRLFLTCTCIYYPSYILLWEIMKILGMVGVVWKANGTWFFTKFCRRILSYYTDSQEGRKKTREKHFIDLPSTAVERTFGVRFKFLVTLQARKRD